MNYMNFVFTKSKKNILTFTFFSGDSFPVDPKPTLSLTYHYLCLAMPGMAFATMLLVLLREDQDTCVLEV